MSGISDLGTIIAKQRSELGLRQVDLAEKSGLSRATIDALENGRARGIGFSKVTRILDALGLQISIGPATSRRPTLDELRAEDADD